MADEPKTDKPTGGDPGKTGDDGQSEMQSDKGLTQDQVDKLISERLARQEKKLKGDILGELGVEDLDSAKAAIKERDELKLKLDETKTDAEKALIETEKKIREHYDSKLAEVQPLIEKAAAYVEEQERARAFADAGVADGKDELVRGLMAINPQREGETVTDHIKRILEAHPELKGERKQGATPPTPGETDRTTPQDAMRDFAKEIRKYAARKAGGPEDWSKVIKPPLEVGS